jgi:hypothetical protein
MEIRDFRFGLNSSLNNNNNNNNNNTIDNPYKTHYILLHPSMQTLLADINSITNDGNYVWTQEDKYTLESQLLLATTDPLCLNPNPKVSIIKNKIHLHKFKMNNRQLKQSVYKIFQNNFKKQLKWNEFTLPYPFQVLKKRKNCQSCNQLCSTENKYLNKQTTNDELKKFNFDQKSCENNIRDAKKTKDIFLNIKVFECFIFYIFNNINRCIQSNKNLRTLTIGRK